MKKRLNTTRLRQTCIVLLQSASLFLATGAAAASQNLLILGDSLSAGYGINRGKDWSTLLSQQLAQSHPQIKVINASISGETTSGALARLPAILASTRPRWVLIALGANDGLRGQSLRAMEKNLSDIIALVKQHGSKALLAGMYLPPNYGKVFNERFHAVYVEVAKKENIPLLPFLLEGVGGNRMLMQNDGLHPNEEAQTIIFRNVWPFLRGNF